MRLVRSHAIRDSASPPPPGPVCLTSEGGESEGSCSVGGEATSVTDSGRGDTDTPDPGEVYTDRYNITLILHTVSMHLTIILFNSTGTDLTQFIITTLNKNAKDRVLMLKLEQEMTSLVRDAKKTHHKFPHMSSYHRMVVHRYWLTAYPGLLCDLWL